MAQFDYFGALGIQRWRDHFYAGATMPEQRPAYNPHRRTDLCAESRDPDGLSRAFGLDELNILLERARREGYAIGYQERDAVVPQQLEQEFDDGWRAGMSEQHDRFAADLGDRLLALHEMLERLPDAFVQYEGMTSRFAEFAQIMGATVGSLIDDHAGGPHYRPRAREPVPAITAAGSGADLVRVEQLREWLRPYFDDRRADEAQLGLEDSR